MRRLARWVGWSLVGLVVLVAAGLGGGYLWLRQSLPQLDGEIRVAGLDGPVTITRDAHALPRIEAGSLLDATFALGFVHAQDRLWQMELRRRLGAGRLAELVGERGVSTDRFMRVMGFYRLAEASLAHLEPDTIAWLEAYAAGVNAFLAQRRGPLPPEFLVLRHTEIEPWRPADSLVWIRLMALDLGGNYKDELLRARLAKQLSDEQIADIWPGPAPRAPVTLARALSLEPLAAALPPEISGGGPRGQGSNGWVIAGERTATGAPLLANDPHLGLRAPGVWYLASIEAPDYAVSGVTFAGVPGVILGHNRRIAWGFTNTGSDTQDLFIERLDPEDPDRYLTPTGSEPFQLREEVIRVKDGVAETLRIRATRHGPVLSDVVDGAGEMVADDAVVALAWTALRDDDRSLQALLGLGQADDWEGFLAAARDVAAPMQNVFYADVDGRIGFVAPGRVPIRKAGDGRWPVPGWSGAYDWVGEIRFAELPQSVDPPSGAFVNANNRIVADDYRYLLTADWAVTYRARRLAELLAGDGLTVADLAAMQLDQRSLLAADLLPIMLATEFETPAARAAADRLAAWDRVMRADAIEPLLFAAWYRELSRLIYADELGDLFPSFWHVRPRFMDRILTARQVWCDDVTTDPPETCAELTARALELALADLAARYGGDQTAWRWGHAHAARMGHGLLKDLQALAWLFNIEIATGGDNTTVNVAHFSPRNRAHPFASTHAASFRAVYDLSDLARSRLVTATGQSGNPLSPYYRDLTAIWAAGGSLAPAADADPGRAIGRLRLRPH